MFQDFITTDYYNVNAKSSSSVQENQMVERENSKLLRIEYDPSISMDQVIACKIRAKKEALNLDKSSFRTLKIETRKLKTFNDELYERADSFLDDLGMFIVSTSPMHQPKNYIKFLKTNSNPSSNQPCNDESSRPAEDPNEPFGVKLPSVTFSRSFSFENSTFFGKITSSSLLRKRSKFSWSDQHEDQEEGMENK